MTTSNIEWGINPNHNDIHEHCDTQLNHNFDLIRYGNVYMVRRDAVIVENITIRFPDSTASEYGLVFQGDRSSSDPVTIEELAFAVLDPTSAPCTSACSWSWNESRKQLTVKFRNPPSKDCIVIWEFWHSPGTPPLRLRVTVKRSNVALLCQP